MNFFETCQTALSDPAYTNLNLDPMELMMFCSQMAEQNAFNLLDASHAQVTEWIDEFTSLKGLRSEPMYGVPKPREHNAIPSSIFALPIASMANVGQSLAAMDQKPFQQLAKKVGLKIENPKLSGEVLCPKKDMPIFTSILQELLALPVDSFTRYDENGETITDGEVVSIDYWHLLDKALLSVNRSTYNRQYYSRRESLEQFQETLNRIAALRLSWITPKSSKVTAQALIPILTFDADTFILRVRPTYSLYQLFKDDRVIRLNRELINVPETALESTILSYISAQRQMYNEATNTPFMLKDPIHILELLDRCYPNLPDKERVSSSTIYRNRRSMINKAMTKLRNEGLISYEEATLRRMRVYRNIVCRAGLKTEKFVADFRQPKPSPASSIKSYLYHNPLPRSRNVEVRRTYAEKHLERMAALADKHGTELKNMFSNVSTNTVKALERMASEYDNQPLLDVLVRLKDVRSRKK
ncbi:hypothetical protein ACP3V3_02365 [Vibrio sp. PNB22_3_1]